ncbi:MAG TPA: hypothetical protein DDX92_05070 [Flavobacteriales bacterium]|nr:hypothetical protein [Flavobacteriales bacterium]
MGRTVFLAISSFYALGLAMAVLVLKNETFNILALAGLMPEVVLLFFVLTMIRETKFNRQLLLLSIGLTFGILSTFGTITYDLYHDMRILSGTFNVLRMVFYIGSLAYISDIKLPLSSLRHIPLVILIICLIAVLIPTLYLVQIDNRGFEFYLILHFSLNFIMLIQALIRKGKVGNRVFLSTVAAVFLFTLGDFTHELNEHIKNTLLVISAHILYFSGQYLFVASTFFYFDSNEHD